ncbi:putative RING/FYVE/PHD zinc finger protein [Quillaja saponaria]|nr:putative RING/FYVE/PHD zinc finger protein [Quillaja saponaria]
MKTAGLEDRHSKPVASTVNCKLISCSTLSEKDVKSCEPELPSNLKEEQPSGKDDGTSKEAQLRVTRDEGAVAAKTLSILQKFHGNCPAMENIWNGNLEILHSALSGGNYEGILRHFRLYEGFSAHPPARVSRRAYEFSKKLTGVLEFKFHPIQDQWPKTFQSKLPDGNDIGLYFYAQKSERSKKHYSILLKFIEKNYLMMKSSIEDVELLVFPSKVLAADCQRLDEGSLFMWGVFRHLKCNTIY